LRPSYLAGIATTGLAITGLLLWLERRSAAVK
jgi:hypothetical protein